MAFSLASFALLVSSAPAALVMQPQAVALAQAASQQKQVSEEPVDGSPPVESENVIVVTGEGADPLKDPLESVNIQAYELTRDIDKAFVEPIADVYEEDLPSPIRKGLRNFLRNLMEPVNALNYLLQLKPGKALETVGRFAINPTVGMTGLFDVAKNEPFNLPYRRNGFGNTFYIDIELLSLNALSGDDDVTLNPAATEFPATVNTAYRYVEGAASS